MSEEEKKVVEEEGGESAPLWIISFADMISLLMAFFVMLSTCNTYDKVERKKLEATFAATLLYSGGWLTSTPNNSMSPGVAGGDDVEEGPETPPLEDTAKTGQINQTVNPRFFTDKLFLVSQEFLFHSTSLGLTPQGKEWLDALAFYLSGMKGQILIAEPVNAQIRSAGPQRSLVIAGYLVQKHIDSDRINISTRRTSLNPSAKEKQEIEIGLVEKEICP